MTGLRLAVAALAVTAAALVVWQKHLLTRPGPGLVLVLACALPFVLDVRWPRSLRPGWPSVTGPLVSVPIGLLAITHRVLSAFRTHASPALRSPDPSLTPRELEVLRLVGRGLANSEIAGQLYISEVTVKAHLGHVLTKLGLRDRAAAIVYAFDTGLASPGG